MNGALVAQFEKRFHGGTVIRASLQLPANEFSTTVLFGPSGCGKTTILRALAGLDRPELGTIAMDNEVWLDTERSICRSPQERDVGFCFQEYALFPHLTVRENIAYGIRRKKPDRDSMLDEMLVRFQLTGLERRYPHQISGGQQQRVALARALVRRPRLLLLDEPLSSLDTTLRDELRIKMRQLLSGFGIPVVIVTHDRLEAIALADQIIVMDSGRVEQSGSVEQVFSKPLNSNVAKIVGIETIEVGEVIDVTEGLAVVDVRGVRLLAVAPAEPQRKVHVCIQGEHVTLQKGDPGPQSNRNQFAGTIQWITPEGPLLRIGIDCGFELTALVTRPACDELGLKVGDITHVSIKASSIHLVPANPLYPTAMSQRLLSQSDTLLRDDQMYNTVDRSFKPKEQ